MYIDIRKEDGIMYIDGRKEYGIRCKDGRKEEGVRSNWCNEKFGEVTLHRSPLCTSHSASLQEIKYLIIISAPYS